MSTPQIILPSDSAEVDRLCHHAQRVLNLPYIPTPRQLIFHMAPCYGMDEPLLFGGAMGGSKLLHSQTPIPTPTGFRPIGDLQRGDLVLGRDGRDYAVLDASIPELQPGWKLTFDDGSELIAHDGHNWLTFSRSEMIASHKRTPEYRAARRATRPSRSNGARSERFSTALAERNTANPPPSLPPPTGTVRTTREIVDTLRTREGWVNHAIPVTQPLTLPDAALPLDPYLFGLWLGDGTSATGTLTTMDPELVDAFVDNGFLLGPVHTKPNNRASTYRLVGLTQALRSLGVIGNKHVPLTYLWASHEQRLALLQGLLDTDGSVNFSGCVEFSSTNESLARAAAHLARTLGHKARIRERRAALNGKDCGPVWSIKFQPRMQVFRLARKAERVVLASRPTTRFRYIVKAEPVAATWMRCLRVASPDHLFLAGEHLIPTHNSAGIAGDAIAECREVPNNRVLIARKELKTFRKSTLEALLKFMPPDAVHKTSAFLFLFANGSQLHYGGLGREEDKRKLQSSEWGSIYLDEAHELEYNTFLMAGTRLRWLPAAEADNRVNAKGRLKLRLTANPEPGWIKDHFITPETTPPGYTFIPALPSDNPHLPPNYVASMRAVLPPEWYRAYILGDWTAFTPSNAILNAELVGTALRTALPPGHGCCWGIDVGRFGGDKTVIAQNRLPVFSIVDSWNRCSINESVERIVTHYHLAHPKPDVINVDDDGVGGGVTDGLQQAQREGRLGGARINPVIAQSTPRDPEHYATMKAELWFAFKRLMETTAIDLPRDVEDLQGQAEAHRYDVKGGKAYVEPKALVKSRIGHSPDEMDAIILTMYSSAPSYVAYMTAAERQALALANATDDERRLLAAEMQRQRRNQTLLRNFGSQTGRHFLPKKDPFSQ